MPLRPHAKYHNSGVDSYWKPKHLMNFTKKQLVDIARKRSLKTFRRNKEELTEAIQQHAANEAFPRFFQLPLELRQAIYDLYFNDFETNRGSLTHPAQPPLTMASSALRTEALPRFYSENRFNIHMLKTPQLTLRRSTAEDSWNWLHNLTQANLATIRHLRITIFGFAIDLNFGAVYQVPVVIHDLWHRRVRVPAEAIKIMEDVCHSMQQPPSLRADFDRALEAALTCFQKIQSSRRGLSVVNDP